MIPVTITVANVEYPQAGKKQGRITDSTGKMWGVWANEVSNYQQFTSYEVLEYKTNDFKGKTYYTIVRSKPVNLNGGGAGATPRPTGQPVRPTPPPVQAYDVDVQRRMDIYICGAFNNIMANPGVDPVNMTPEAMISLVNQLKAVWKRTLGPQAQESVQAGSENGFYNDEIGF